MSRENSPFESVEDQAFLSTMIILTPDKRIPVILSETEPSTTCPKQKEAFIRVVIIIFFILIYFGFE